MDEIKFKPVGIWQSMNDSIEKTMTITEKEIVDDFKRFLRHEAMRANTSQENIKFLVKDELNEPVSLQVVTLNG